MSGQLRLYIGSDNGHIYCLSTATSPSQRIIWDYAGEDGLGLGCVESSPTVYAGNVYVGSSWWQGTDLVALDAYTGELTWNQGLEEEARATCAAADGYVYIGVDTGWHFFRLASAIGNGTQFPFDASFNRPQPPDPAGDYDYFFGSAALTSAGLCIVGNDNYALYALSSANLQLRALRPTGGIVCSSPAISYAAESSYRWIYVLSRADNGILLAYRQQLNP